ncbi:hypothetical protein [Cellulophaga fucicola]|nr:hypothetical protein [Cellulophaga fucicola]
MKTNQKILEEFGRILITSVFDLNYRVLKNNLDKNLKSGQLDKKINSQSKEAYENALFSFLNFFEENEQFKIVYEEEGKQVNLLEISEMLKAEIHGKDGWIEQFSEELKKENDN